MLSGKRIAWGNERIIHAWLVFWGGNRAHTLNNNFAFSSRLLREGLSSQNAT